MSQSENPAMLQEFNTFKEAIKKLDPGAFDTDAIKSCGEWFKFLCDRYGIPASAVYTLPLSNACKVLLFACDLKKCNGGSGFYVEPEPSYMRVVANRGVPPVLSGVRVKVLAKCLSEAVYFVEVVDKNSKVFETRVFLYRPDLQELHKKTRAVQLDD
jgi:hypothetical protein